MTVEIVVKLAVVIVFALVICWGCLEAMREPKPDKVKNCRTCRHEGRCNGKKWFSCFRNSWMNWEKK